MTLSLPARPFATRVAIAAAAAAALVVATGTPARAHGFEAARLDSPAPGDVHDTSPAVAGYFEHGDTGVAGVDLSLALVSRTGPDEPPGEDPCAPPSLAPLDAGGQQQFPFQLSLPAVPCNGEYSITATGRSRPHLVTGAVSTATVSAAFALAVPPLPPEALVAHFDEDGREVALEWEPNAELDLLGYLVERSVDGTRFEVVGDTNEPGFVDEVADEGGTHAYRVRAVRRGPNADVEAVASDPSNEDSVQIVAVAPPTSTTTADGSTTTTAPPPSREVDLSNFGSLQDRAQRPVQEAPRVTTDTGFRETLPFAVPPPTEPPEPSTTTTAAVDPSDDLAVIEYEDSGGPDREAVLVPAAGALALLVGSLQMRYLLRRASAGGHSHP